MGELTLLLNRILKSLVFLGREPHSNQLVFLLVVPLLLLGRGLLTLARSLLTLARSLLRLGLGRGLLTRFNLCCLFCLCLCLG